MSDLTDDQVRALLDGNELRSDSQSHTVWLLARALLQARADAAAAQALILERAVAMAEEMARKAYDDDQGSYTERDAMLDVAKAIRALAPDAGTAELAKLRERAEKAEQDRVAEWNKRRDADGSRDAARAACDTMRAERDTLAARLAEWQASQHYSYTGRDGKPVLARDLEDRLIAAEAEVARLKTAQGAAGVLLADLTAALDPMDLSRRDGAARDWTRAVDAADAAPTYLDRPTALQMIRAALTALAQGEPTDDQA